MAAEESPVEKGVQMSEDIPILRRRRSAPSETDPLADILAKLGLGDGGGGTVVSKQDEEGVIMVMVDVLQIPVDQAKFFLESANNDVAVAVDLHFELIGEANSGKRVRHDPSAFSSFMSNVPSGASVRHRWQNRDVHILGLPEGWHASVSSITGQIMFRHTESGISQSEVPPGFADITPPEEAIKVGPTSPSDTMTNNDGVDDLPDLVDDPAPAKATWPSPKPPSAGASFDFTPRNNIFKSGTTPFFSSPEKGAPFSFSSSSSSNTTFVAPLTSNSPEKTPVSVAMCGSSAIPSPAITTGPPESTMAESMGEDEL